ncbi:MAG: adenosylcobinamide-GDP ribazoletransferase [Spirochaetota bacterium]
MGKIRNKLLTAFSLLSRIKVGIPFDPDFSFVGFLLPVVGLFILLVNLGLYYLGGEIIPDILLLTILILAVQYFLFNIFHFDGLLDSSDALFCFADKEKRLAILRDAGIGSFAFFCGAVYLVLKIYLMYRSISILNFFIARPSRLGFDILFFAYPVSGRIAAALIPCVLKPARTSGLGFLLADYKKTAALGGIALGILAVAMPAVLLGILFNTHALFFLICFSGALAAFFFVSGLFKAKIGGFTGDTQGFAVELGELLHMLIFYLLLIYGAGGKLGV